MVSSQKGSLPQALAALLEAKPGTGELGRAMAWLAGLVGHSALPWFLCARLLQRC